jgi:DNA-binding response OmpR family regulator
MRVKAIFRRIEFEEQKMTPPQNEKKLAFGDITMDVGRKTVRIKDDEIALTPNEYAVLRFLLEHKSEAVSRDAILDCVWQCSADVETRAADDTVRRLRKKLHNSHVVIEAVWGFGFRLKGYDENDR